MNKLATELKKSLIDQGFSADLADEVVAAGIAKGEVDNDLELGDITKGGLPDAIQEVADLLKAEEDGEPWYANLQVEPFALEVAKATAALLEDGDPGIMKATAGLAVRQGEILSLMVDDLNNFRGKLNKIDRAIGEIRKALSDGGGYGGGQITFDSPFVPLAGDLSVDGVNLTGAATDDVKKGSITFTGLQSFVLDELHKAQIGTESDSDTVKRSAIERMDTLKEVMREDLVSEVGCDLARVAAKIGYKAA